jgi:hypothetical protein
MVFSFAYAKETLERALLFPARGKICARLRD